MYDSKFVAALKVDGQVLREYRDTVYIKFGAEYSLFLKNLSDRRAVAKITIDGQSVADGGFIVPAYGEIDIERFVKDMNTGNRFKFIEKTAGIEAHRGNKVEDGLIRIDFEFEKQWTPPPSFYDISIGGSSWTHDSFSPAVSKGVMRGTSYGIAANASTETLSANSVNTAGITVPGSLSDQQFKTGYCNTDGVRHTMVFRLLGSEDGRPVQETVTVNTKPTCVTCGRHNKATAKFCSECGTSLQIVA